MKPFVALVRRHIVEGRWTLALSAAALFGFGWLWVYVTSLNETEILRLLESGEGGGRIQWMRNMGIGDAPSSVSIMMAFWTHPLIILLLSIWPISRGSAAVAAEVERGTMDVILSRPISRWAYLASGILISIAGLAILSAAILAGASIAVHYNVLREPPGPWTLLWPALNLGALGLPIYGYTLLASSIDHVRWRPMTIGSVLTLGGVIAFVVSSLPVFQEMSWRPWVERISIFKRFDPIELVTDGQSFEFNVSLLAGIGAAGITLAFVAFSVRDLPTNG
jgi:ABC-2 type transport system permease protein